MLALLERIESLPEENQPHSPVRANILCAVGLLGRQAAEATPILRRLATHRDPYVAFAASTALAAISNGEAPTWGCSRLRVGAPVELAAAPP